MATLAQPKTQPAGGAALTASIMLPAYLALFAATGIAAYILGYHIDVTAFSVPYAIALILSVGATFVANYGSESARFGAQMVRFVTVPILLVIAILGNSELFFTHNWVADANSIVAGYIGLIMIICILMVGLPIEGKPVPVAMPLVATLSLFGLLNLVLVDTIVQVGFLIFVASSLFLIGYERLISNWQRRRRAAAYVGQVWDESHSEEHMRHAATQFAGASAVWFAIFVAGALLAYTPLYALLPGIMPLNALSRLSQSAQSEFSWNTSPQQMEVRGGNHALSERPVLKINVRQGQSPGLWRGRVYRHYVASSWKDDINSDIRQRLSSYDLTPLELTENLSMLNSRFGIPRIVTAQIEPVSPVNRILYSAGRPIAMKAAWTELRINTNTGAAQSPWYPSNYATPIYTVTGESVELLGAATLARGLSESELSEWRADPRRAPVLLLPEDPQDAAEFRLIARQILDQARSQGRKVDTPVQRVLAVNDFLRDNYVYSLNTSITPSNQDGVLYFLKETRAGACDMFASSMALILRAMNVPTRLVTGYLETEGGNTGAEANPEGSAGTPDGNGGRPNEITLRERDAHAWVEYYSPQLGWVTHDPSAGTRMAEDSWLQRVSSMFSKLLGRGPGSVVLFPIVGLMLLAAGLFWPQIERKLGRTPLTGDADEQQRQRVQSTYQQAARLVRRYAKAHKSAPPRRALTTSELDDWLSRTPLPEAARQEFAALAYLHNAARYGSLPPDTADAELKASLRRLKNALKQ